MRNLNENVDVLVAIIMFGTFFMIIAFTLLLVKNKNKLFASKQRLFQAEVDYQKKLLSAVIQSQDEERIKIGRDLHDDVGTALAHLVLSMDLFDMDACTTSSLNAFKTNTKHLINRIANNVRAISHNLNPPTLELYGLEDALIEIADLTNQLQKQLQVNLSFDARTGLNRLNTIQARSIYRVIEELITNTIKHAGATLINIYVESTDTGLIVNYTDNGRGLKPNHQFKGMGLHNIITRLNVINATWHENWTNGCLIIINIPFIDLL